jgi:hypothetical protein
MSISPAFILLNSKGKEIEELFDISIETSFDTDISNQPYDYSSPVNDGDRPGFFTPEPVSPKKFTGFVFGSNKNAFPPKPVLRRQPKVYSILGKRKFHEAFDSEDDERYGQHIGTDFFAINVGHGVRPASPTPDKWEDPNREWNEYVQKEGRRERDSESKYDPEEIIQWCFKYLSEKKIQF